MTDDLQLIGHAQQEAHLAKLIRENHLPHALLLAGPKGIGKSAFAMKLAAHLLGKDSGSGIQDSGGFLFDLPASKPESRILNPDHSIMRRLAAGSHPDFLLLKPEFDEKKKEFKAEITIEAARKVSDFMSLTPSEGAWRVCVINSIDELNRSAANALLKVLEEPPPRAALILVSHNPSRLLPTIRSRCQTVACPTLSLEDFLKVLALKQVTVEAEEGRVLALLSGFSPGLAIPMKEAGGPAIYAALLEVARNPNPAAITQFLDTYIKKDGEQSWQLLGWLTDLFLTRLQKSILASSGPEIIAGEWKLLQSLANIRSPDDWFALWERASGMFGEASRLYLDKRLVFQQFLYALYNPSSMAA